MAEDVRCYGRWMRDEAEKRIGHLYPKIEITAEMIGERPDLKPYEGRKLTVIAWLWARTVKSPNPAFTEVDVPLASTFMLSTKKGKEAYVEPVIEGREYRFAVKVGTPPDAAGAKAGTGAGKRHGFRCLISRVPVTYHYIRSEGQAGRMGARLMAIVAAGDRGRVYLAPSKEHSVTASHAHPEWAPDACVPERLTGGTCYSYGLTTFGDLFTDRQLVALTTFSDLVGEAMERVRRDAAVAGLRDDGRALRDGGTSATAYAEAVAVYLAFAADRVVDRHTSISTWDSSPSKLQLRNTFARQAIPMTWDYGEGNPFCMSSGTWLPSVEWVAKSIALLPSAPTGSATQADASTQDISCDRIISTDPPYYDNIAYADLSDFFFVWLRRSLRSIFPSLFSTMTVPKAEELVALPYRHGTKSQADTFFMNGMTRAIKRMAEQTHTWFPITIYYAFKQSEIRDNRGVASTGWETFLEAMISAGLAVSGTWPLRTELGNRILGLGSNVLASSVVLVCRQRCEDSAIATRRDFIATLKAELPLALAHLQRGNIAPVDLAQAAIGPGMAVYTRYAKVLDASGSRVSVGDALALINQTLDEVLAEQEGDFDADSRWALAWFEQYGFDAGDYGVAETLSKAKNTSVAGMVEAGILRSRAGKVRLMRPQELPSDWDPARDDRLTAWETVHHVIRVMEQGGESAAAGLVRKLGGFAEVARELCYRLYTVCERKKRAAEALAYNGLVQSWPEISRLAKMDAQPEQTGLFDGDRTEDIL